MLFQGKLGGPLSVILLLIHKQGYAVRQTSGQGLQQLQKLTNPADTLSSPGCAYFITFMSNLPLLRMGHSCMPSGPKCNIACL